MSRDRKRQLSWYQPDDTEAIARHLERMAGKGWLLEKVDNWIFTYRRAQPARVRYTVTFFPEASVFDPRPYPGAGDVRGLLPGRRVGAGGGLRPHPVFPLRPSRPHAHRN